MDTQTSTHAPAIPIGWDATLITRGGIVMGVRPVRPTDEPILAALFERVSPVDLRFRFLSGMRHVDHSLLQLMIDVDYDRTITFLAFDGSGEPVATAMLAADHDRKNAEVAVSVRSDLKGRGVGWTLLQHVMRYGEAHGIENIRSIESRQNSETIKLERDAGFEFEPCDGDPTDVVAVKHLPGRPA